LERHNSYFNPRIVMYFKSFRSLSQSHALWVSLYLAHGSDVHEGIRQKITGYILVCQYSMFDAETRCPNYWKLLYWLPLILITKSLYPLLTLLIFLVLSFIHPCWIPTNESSLIDCAQNVKKISGFCLAVRFLKSTLRLVAFQILSSLPGY